MNNVDHRRRAGFVRFPQSEWAAYIDDTWKVTPRLTITAGLRWEVAQPMLDASGRGVNIQLNESLPSVANVSDMSKHPVYVRTGSGEFLRRRRFPLPGVLGRSGQQVPGPRRSRLPATAGWARA